MQCLTNQKVTTLNHDTMSYNFDVCIFNIEGFLAVQLAYVFDRAVHYMTILTSRAYLLFME